MSNEIKPSFSMNYFVLMILTALIVSGVGVGVSRFYESKPNKELESKTLFEIDFLSQNSLPNDVIESKYFIKGNPDKEIHSLYRKKVSIKNIGREGVEGLLVSVAANNEKSLLIPHPIISTVPEIILNAIEVRKESSSSESKHIWIVSLLNPTESIIFEYTAYSEDKLDNLEINIQPRKKNWSVIDLQPANDGNVHVGFIKTFTVGIMVILIASQLLYVFIWLASGKYREKYKTFPNFWRRWPKS